MTEYEITLNTTPQHLCSWCHELADYRLNFYQQSVSSYAHCDKCLRLAEQTLKENPNIHTMKQLVHWILDQSGDPCAFEVPELQLSDQSWLRNPEIAYINSRFDW